MTTPQDMTREQVAALKKLQTALLACKRAGLCLVGIDGDLLAAAEDDDLENEVRGSSATEAILRRSNEGHPLVATVQHHGCYRDSGGA